MAEVHKGRSSHEFSDEEDNRILDFFEHEFIKVVELDRDIASHVNRLCRDKSLFPSRQQSGLRPNDAVHLATALRVGCDYLLAWDDKLLDIIHTGIKVEKPTQKGQLSLRNEIKV